MSNEQNVTVQKVSYPHGQHQVVGNLFLPPGFDEAEKYPAVIFTHPFGGVKEQTAGLYARKLAEQGFIALAYDASHYGESGGEPRLYEVPGDRVEDIRCGVDYLSIHPQVDENRIGALGICAGGGYTVSCFDVGSARRAGVPRGRPARTDHLRAARPAPGGDRRAAHPGSAWGAPANDQLRARISGRDHPGDPGVVPGGL